MDTIIVDIHLDTLIFFIHEDQRYKKPLWDINLKEKFCKKKKKSLD